MEILFHRGKMLLLQQVTITDVLAIGEFTVPAENCEGHEPKPNMPVMRGVDIIEMAFQLLAVLAAQDPELANIGKGKICVAREIGGVKFNGLILPGDHLVLDTSVEVNVEECAGILRIESNRMTAWAGGKKKCTIASVAIVAFDPTIISQREPEVS